MLEHSKSLYVSTPPGLAALENSTPIVGKPDSAITSGRQTVQTSIEKLCQSWRALNASGVVLTFTTYACITVDAMRACRAER
uniref:Uncharacterized protein n=1 Tax=Ascaris lumbricoides TaxID=6252 RepID=A0A0M3I9M0_ASCLU